MGEDFIQTLKFLQVFVYMNNFWIKSNTASWSWSQVTKSDTLILINWKLHGYVYMYICISIWFLNISFL